jgi:hypothetical protein
MDMKFMSLQQNFSSFGSGPTQGQSVLRVYADSVEFILHRFPYKKTLLPSFLRHNAVSVMQNVVTLIQNYVSELDGDGRSTLHTREGEGRASGTV